MPSPNLKVSEIFASVQGEGNLSGKPAIFVRFFGCNLNCPFCDSKYAWKKGGEYKSLSVSEVVKEIKNLPSHAKLIIFTGGEPLIQNHKLLAMLARELHKELFTIAIETNGTVPFSSDFPQSAVDWVVVSPKTEDFTINTGDELKVLYQGQSVRALKRLREKTDFRHYFLQPIFPEGNLQDLENAAEYMRRVQKAVKECCNILQQLPAWRLSFQVHKVAGLR